MAKPGSDGGVEKRPENLCSSDGAAKRKSEHVLSATASKHSAVEWGGSVEGRGGGGLLLKCI